MNLKKMIRKEGAQMDELPRWNKLINELKDRPDKERNRGNFREQLNIIKRNEKNEVFSQKERLKDGKG